MRHPIVLIALALVGVVTAFAQIDREAGNGGSYARLVPPPFRGFAHYPLAIADIERQDFTGAAEHARSLVADRPMPAEHLSLLARSLFLAGEVDRAGQVFELAGARGWRDPLVQIAVGEAMLAQGNHLAAAQRASALVATGRGGEQGEALTAAILSTAEGREAFARVMASDGRWRAQLKRHIGAIAGGKTAQAIAARAEELGPG